MSECCLTLLVPSALKAPMLDALLMAAPANLISSAPAAVHGLSDQAMSTSEQVLAMVGMTQVQVFLALADSDQVVASLGRQFAGSGVRYWLVPVLGGGELA